MSQHRRGCTLYGPHDTRLALDAPQLDWGRSPRVAPVTVESVGAAGRCVGPTPHERRHTLGVLHHLRQDHSPCIEQLLLLAVHATSFLAVGLCGSSFESGSICVGSVLDWMLVVFNIYLGQAIYSPKFVHALSKPYL